MASVLASPSVPSPSVLVSPSVLLWSLLVVLAPACSSSSSLVLRLSGERRKPHEGRVEVFLQGEWGTVCDDDFSLSAAHVVCRGLGFVNAESWAPRAKYGQGQGRIWLDNVHCSGSEASLLDCQSNGVGVSDCKHSEDVGVACAQRRIAGFSFIKNNAQQQGVPVQVEDVRIRATYSHRKRVPITEGFLEVKDAGKWRQICDVDWTSRNSRVVCGMFGFPVEKKYNPKPYKLLASRRKKNFWSHGVECSGNEASLSECRLGREVPLRGNLTCSQGGPVVVSCAPGRAFAPSVSAGFSKAYRVEQPLVRLRGGARVGEGRVEVLKGGVWGTVCDDGWDLNAATVVCRELGFGSAKEALTGARLGQGMGPVHMSEVQCSGFEKSLTECRFNRESGGCSHEDDAAARCNVPQMNFHTRLRLSGGRNPLEGRVEVLAQRNGSLVWGSVCSEGWGTLEAVVVCRQLGLGFASHAFQETWYWQSEGGADAVVMSGVKCSGAELTLEQCLHHGNHVTCPRGGGRFAAGVSCTHTAPDLVLNAPVVEQTTYLEDRPLYALTCALEENCLSSSASSADSASYRRLMRFSSQIHNNGQSDFRPRAGPQAWVWHECHRHYHSMEVFTHYDLLSLNGTKVAEGHKASFCLEDTACDEGIQKRYECANFGQQGVTVGCWDTYRHDIDCQWIDITDLLPGDYIFQVVINPNFEVAESDYTNNVMKCNARYDGHRMWTYNCHTGGSLSSDFVDMFPGLLTNQISHR
ncbi:lysyl oxidase homolog 2A-like [Boleophthalmus pectinirostris]|uniref:lysyl oxidase homolog 2A-like n=1 Tax=Boleophthalmus pectinirostris TaxID=150288 RepID=UPI0024332BAD|nr:lysyl oxidase homolog 2A-like [Boleophthalmus pectinirostris]